MYMSTVEVFERFSLKEIASWKYSIGYATYYGSEAATCFYSKEVHYPQILDGLVEEVRFYKLWIKNLESNSYVFRTMAMETSTVVKCSNGEIHIAAQGYFASAIATEGWYEFDSRWKKFRAYCFGLGVFIPDISVDEVNVIKKYISKNRDDFKLEYIDENINSKKICYYYV